MLKEEQQEVIFVEERGVILWEEQRDCQEMLGED